MYKILYDNIIIYQNYIPNSNNDYNLNNGT